MKIGILSRNPELYSTRRLKEACMGRGHQAEVLDTGRFSMFLERQKPSLLYEDRSPDDYDAVIPRIGASMTFYGTAVVRQFEQMGIFSLNSAQAIRFTRDKLHATQILSRHNVGIPVTAFVRDKGTVLQAVDRLGGGPVVIKVLEATQGVGVILAESRRTAKAIIETLQSAKQNVLIQQFIKEAGGQDLRAFVIGDRVAAAMRRKAPEGEFRSNVHQGGVTEAVELDAVYQNAAVQAAQILNLNVAGVDMLESSSGPLIMEVNSSPGLEGIEQATGKDVASQIVGYIEDRVLFPEIDIRQRLTLKSGYGVAEIPVYENSSIAHKQVQTSGLRGQDILVLTISRAGISIPNPKGSREILPGDVLLCFGKMETLKALVPHKRVKPNA